MRGVGRPEALDETKRAEICAVLAVGGSQRMAARYVGVNPNTIRRTARRDKSFARDLARAAARAELLPLTALDRAAQTDRYWRAAAWKLERSDPERFRARRVDGVTPQQLFQVLEEFGEALSGLVPEASGGEQLRERLKGIVGRLRGTGRQQR